MKDLRHELAVALEGRLHCRFALRVFWDKFYFYNNLNSANCQGVLTTTTTTTAKAGLNKIMSAFSRLFCGKLTTIAAISQI